MSVPTKGETFSKLIEHLRLAQEDCAMMCHLYQAEDSNHRDTALAYGFLAFEELLKKVVYKVTELAQGRFQ